MWMGRTASEAGIVVCICARYSIDTSEEGTDLSHKQFDWQPHQQMAE